LHGAGEEVGGDEGGVVLEEEGRGDLEPSLSPFS